METSYKEKYEDILARLERAKNDNDVCDERFCCVINDIIPELAESEDERIRNGLVRLLKELLELGGVAEDEWDRNECEKYIAWLEKQENRIKLSDSAYTSNRDVIEFADKYSYTVWEKLMDKFKKNENYSIGCNDVSDIVLNAIINTYNWLEKQGQVKESHISQHENRTCEENGNFLTHEDEKVRREIINYFQYQSEEEPTRNEIHNKWIAWLENIPYTIDHEKREGFHLGYKAGLEKQGEQNPAEWSEEDKYMYDILCGTIESTDINENTKYKLITWLKSLRPQKYLIPSEEEIEKAAQEWDSKANFNPFYMTMENGKPTGVQQSITTHKESFKAGINWILKFLKGKVKPHWKPNDEQMAILWNYADQNDYDGAVLTSLYNDLKKLKEE